MIEALRDVGHIFVASAGNGGPNGVGDNNDIIPTYPASYDLDNIISVAAHGMPDVFMSFSNIGPNTVDLSAPGGNIYSTLWNVDPNIDYGYISGTSMSAPHVTGVVALIMSKYPALRWDKVKKRVLDTARPVAGMSGDTVTGGVLNAAAAMEVFDSDCNYNGTTDATDISNGTSTDCNGNGVPDECEPDCNDNGVADGCDVSSQTSTDCNSDGIPDECEVNVCCATADCDDGNTCTTDICSKSAGWLCQHTNLSQGASCDDGVFCTDVDECDGAGTCVGTGDPCTQSPFIECCEATDTCLDPNGFIQCQAGP